MPKQYSAPPSLTINQNKKYSAVFNTSRGEIVCELFTKDAPNTVNNFVFLARDKFYHGTVFHRVLPDFMADRAEPVVGLAAGYRSRAGETRHRRGLEDAKAGLGGAGTRGR